MRRHCVDLAYADGQLWARCRCGWVGTRYEVRAVGQEAAYQAAEREARTHEGRLDGRKQRK